MTLLLLALLALALPLSPTDGAPSEYNILVIAPSDNNGTNGDELAIAADLAEQRLRQLSLPFRLKLKRLRTDCGLESPAPSLIRLARELTADDGDALTVAVVGFFCKKTFHELELMGVGSGDSLGLVQIAVNTFLPVGSHRSHYYQLFPSSLAYAEALAHLMKHFGWTRHRIAFTEHHNSFHFEASQQVIRVLKQRGLGPAMQLFKVTDNNFSQREKNVMKTIRSIHILGVRIVYVILPPLETALLICGAYNYGLRWPDYAWIVPDISIGDTTNLGDCHPNAMEGIVSFRTVLSRTKSVDYSTPYDDFAVTLHRSIHAQGLYDSILATALSLNRTFPQVQQFLAGESARFHSQSSKLIAQRTVSQIIGQTLDIVFFHGFLGNSSFDKSGLAGGANIAIFQTANGTDNQLGYYDPLFNKTSFENLSGLIAPSDQLPRENNLLLLPVRVILASCLAACFLLSLANVLLYLIYRREPEIKASSVGLSMLVHLSCFLFMFGSANQLRENIKLIIPPDTLCTVRIWAIYPAGDLIISTILVKICRIYHIFKHFSTIKKVCSDKTLLIAIALILLVKVVILSCWTALDRYRIIEVEIYRSETIPPHYEVVRYCYSRYFIVWTAAVLGYTAILGGILVVVAFKVRKIHRKDFKDTKKINITLSISFISIAIIFPMWWVFRIEGDTTAIKVLLPTLYLIIPASCQLCLFCPKTLPPLHRSLSQLLRTLTHRRPRRRFTQEKIKFLQKPDPSQLSLFSSTSSNSTTFTATYTR